MSKKIPGYVIAQLEEKQKTLLGFIEEEAAHESADQGYIEKMTRRVQEIEEAKNLLTDDQQDVSAPPTGKTPTIRALCILLYLQQNAGRATHKALQARFGNRQAIKRSLDAIEAAGTPLHRGRLYVWIKDE